MRKYTFTILLLLSALVAGAKDVQRITVSGYRLGNDVTVRALSDLKGLTVTPESGLVFSNALLVTSNSNVFKATVPFGYRLSHWMRTWDDPRFERSLGEEIPGSDGALTLTVPYDGKGDWIYLAPIIVVDDRRTVTIAKSPFGEGTVGTNLGQHASMKGDVFKLAAIPMRDEKTGFDHSTFRRWEDGSANYLRNAVVDSNDTFRAEFVPNSWDVTFDANGGEVFPTSKRVTCDATYGWLPTPALTGSKFIGWKSSQSSGGTVNKETRVGAVGPHTLQAQWEKFRYQIDGLVDKESLNRGVVNGGGVYAYGSTATLTAVADEGSQFVRWTDGLVDPLRRIQVVSNATYTAEFAVRTYSVTFSYKNERGERVKVGPYFIKYEGAVPDDKVPSDETVNRWAEHTFQDWSTEEYKKVVRDVNVEALYDTMTYSVEFAYRDWQGNCVTTMPQHVVSGGSATPPSASVYNNWEGMTFRGWQPDYSTIRTNVVVEALYKTNEYVITFCYNNEKGEEEQHTETVLHGELIPFDWVGDMVNRWDGHEFKYWSMGGKPVNNGVVATRAGKIVAVYEGYSTIVFDDGDESEEKAWGVIGEMPTQAFTNFTGTATLASNAFTRTGYEFTGWREEKEGETNHYADCAGIHIDEGEAISLTAQWAPIEYTIRLDGNGGSCNVEKNPRTVKYDDQPKFTVKDIQDWRIERLGYEPLGYWSREKDNTNEVFNVTVGNNETYLIVSNLTTVAGETVTLYAQWKGKDQKVTINDELQSVPYGSELGQPPDPTPKTGYTFAGGWTSNGVSVTFPIMVTGDFNLEPIWKTNTYSVAFHGTDGTFKTQGTMKPQAFTYDEPQMLTANGFTRTGYVFANWTNAMGTAFTDRQVVKNLATNDGAIVDLYAVWDDRRSYTVRFNPKNGDGAPYFQIMRCGKPTALDANRFTRVGYGFAGWGDGGNTVAYTNGAVVTDLAAENSTNDLYAVWTPNRYWVKFEPNGGAGEMTLQAFTYDVAQALTLNAFEKTGHAFAGWTNATATGMSPPLLADGAVVSNLTDVADGTNALFAVWTAKSYEIRFYSAGGSEVAPMTNEFGKAVSAPTSTKRGYQFDGWYDGEVEFDFTSMPARNVRLTAHWTANRYTIRFSPGEGSGEMPDQSFVYDVAQNLTANGFIAPERMVFAGWTNATATGMSPPLLENCAVVSNLTAEANGVVTLTAMWKDAPSYQVAYDGNGATSGAMPTNRFACGEGGTLASNKFAKTGYTFTAWTNETATGLSPRLLGDGAMFAEDLAPTNGTATLKALWTPNRYWVKFESNGADGGETMAPQAFTYDAAQALTSNKLTKTGHSFAGWATNATAAAVYADGAVVSNLTDVANATNVLWASWTVNRYEIRFDPAGGSEVGAQTNAYGSVVSAPADPTRVGWTFVEWRLNGVKFDFDTEKMPAEDITLVAEWAENGHYTVRFNGGGGTNALGQTSYEQLFTNEVAGVLRPNEFVREGHDFAGSWTNATGDVFADGAMVTNLTTMADGVVDLRAVWKAHVHTVTWEVINTTWKNIEYGTMLTTNSVLTPPKDGYLFKGWKWKDGDVVENWPVAMPDEDVTFEPNWEPIHYTIAFYGNEADGGTAMDPIVAVYDQEVTLPSNKFTRAGYEFAGWRLPADASGTVGDGAVVGNLTTTADATVTLSAVWAEEEGNPLAIALGLGGDFNVSVNPSDAWTVIGEPTDESGLQRTDTAQTGGQLVIEIPCAGTLTYFLNIKTGANEFSWTFDDEGFKDDDDVESISMTSDASHTMTFTSDGILRFIGDPEAEKLWKLYNFTWTPKK